MRVTWDFTSLPSCAGACKPNVGVPEGSLKAGKLNVVVAAAESATARALRPAPELVDGAKPDAALSGVMLLRKPANPARHTHRCENMHAIENTLLWPWSAQGLILETRQVGKGAAPKLPIMLTMRSGGLCIGVLDQEVLACG